MKTNSERKMEKIISTVLEVLHQDGIIDCNQYQGGDFNNLVERCKDNLRSKVKKSVLKYPQQDEHIFELTSKGFKHPQYSCTKCGIDKTLAYRAGKFKCKKKK